MTIVYKLLLGVTRVLALITLYSGAIFTKIGDVLITSALTLNDKHSDLHGKLKETEANK